MSDQILSKLLENPVVLGIAVVVCIVLITIILRSRSEHYSDDEHVKETFELNAKNDNEKNEDIISTFMNLPPVGTFEEVTHSGDIVENFPSAEMNVMYSDANGNLATTRDLGLANLTVSGDSQFGDGKIGIKNGGTIYAPGRMHVHGEELLYLLHKNGVIIGKEWGGNGNLTVQGNLLNNGQLNTDRMVVGGDLGAQFSGASINKGSGDWNTMIHNPTSAASVYMAHGGKYGMHINANNKDMDTYALQLYGGDKHLMQVTGKGHMYVAGQTNMNRLVVGDDMGDYQGMSVKKHGDGWMARFDNAKNNANVHMCHGAGYGMHINAQNNGSGQYILECHNNAKAVFTARGNGHVDANGKFNVHAGAPWAIPNGKMADGSLTIGDVGKNYGGGTNYWSESTAGLLMECADVTEIAVHDAGTRVASAMYYNGPANTIEVGRNMGWGTSNLISHGSVTAKGNLDVNGGLSVDGQVWTKNRLSACTEDPWNGAHSGLLVNKGATGWNTLIHNPNNGSNVHIANGDGYGMHINGGSNNKNTEKYILQCWNGERSVMEVKGNGNTWVSNNLIVGGNVSERRNRARWIRIGNMDTRFQQRYWSLLEVEAYDNNNTNLALGKPVSIITGGPHPDVDARAKDQNSITNGKIADANRDGESLADNYYQGYHANADFAQTLQIDLGAEYELSQIVIYNRRAATDRLNGTVIQLFAGDGSTVNRTINTGIWGNVFSKEYCL